MDWVIACNAICARILRPTLNIFVDVPPAACMQRITANRESPELYETAEILNKVRHNYLTAFERLKDEEHIAIVDGNDTIDTVAGRIYGVVEPLLTTR